MTQPNPSTALARAVIDEIARDGIRLVVISPGSRSAALAIAADEHSSIETVVSIDERSAAFHALGWAKATGSPAAVVCTSGTAPANYMPAVVEAEMSLTPLVVVSADRPVELRGVGANQAIDQIDLYGGHVRLSSHIEAPEPSEDRNPEWRSTVARSVAAAGGNEGRPGPVHLNIAFREPTVPATDDGRTIGEVYDFDIGGRPDGGPWLKATPSQPPPPDISGTEVTKGVVVAGEGTYDRERLLVAADKLGWPLLATALSGLRGRGVVGGYHHLMADGIPPALVPEFVLAVGSTGPSDRLESLMAAAGSSVRVDYWGRHIDPGRTASQVLHADPVATLETLAEVGGRGDRRWVEQWLRADRTLADAMTRHLLSADSLSGAAIALAMNELPWDYLVAASSLPVREIDAHLRIAGRVVANRGASGIDGFVSTALGVARAAGRAVALAGDLSLLHDANGFLIEPRPDLVVVVFDNGGGGLFDSLPVAAHAPGFERLFITPHGRRFAKLAELFGLRYAEATSRDGLLTAMAEGQGAGGISLIRVPIDRHRDLETRKALDSIGAAVASGLDA